jgi:hypothetical protein
MLKHGLVVRSSLEDDGRWFASAEKVPEALAATAVAGGDLSATATARDDKAGRRWPAESSFGATEEEAILTAVRRVLARGLAPAR